jgi:hypothetical protein
MPLTLSKSAEPALSQKVLHLGVLHAVELWGGGEGRWVGREEGGGGVFALVSVYLAIQGASKWSNGYPAYIHTINTATANTHQ